MKRFSIYVFIFSLISVTGANGNELLHELKKDGYKVEKIKRSTSLNNLIADYYKQKENHSYMDLESFKKLFKAWNPHLRDRAHLKGQYVYTESPFSPYISYQYAPSLKSLYQKDISSESKADFYQAFMGQKKKSKGRLPASSKRDRSFIGFMHVTLSQGEFSENINSSRLTNNQNSPFTFGLGGVFLFDKFSKYSLSGSLYVSKLTVSDVEDPNNRLNNINVDIPNEIGSNLYIIRNTESFISNFYGGIDYERFSTLNFEDILTNGQRDLTHNQEQMVFATVGVSFNKKVILPTAFKVSTSYVLNSRTDLSGYKYMLYANQKLNKGFWYHLLYKKHSLVSSATNRKVGISRFGIGVGMGF